jgi:hypothetical protein
LRSDDLVWVVQEGYFETELEEQFLAQLENHITDACAAGGGECQLVADSQRLEGVSLMGRVRFERFFSRHGKAIKRVAVMMPKDSKTGFALSVVADLVPSVRTKFVFSGEEALKVMGRSPEAKEIMDGLIAKATWHGAAK